MLQQSRAGARGISLQSLLDDARYFGGDRIRVSSCCGDSRQCRPGDLFAAMIGPNHDGHDFAYQAIERGASAVLAERILPLGVPTCLVDDSRVAYGRVCHALAGTPADQLPVIGISGTHGKTTTAMLIAAILEAAEERVGIISSLGYCDGEDVVTGGRTTPGPAELANWLVRMANNGCTRAIVEASCTGLAQQRLAGLELDVAVMTNVRRAHLDAFGSVLNYRRIKKRLFDHLKPEGFAVINADDPSSKFLLSEISNPVITVGMQNAAELEAEVVERHRSEQMFLLTAGQETIPVRTSIIGNHHVYNCLEAAALGLVLGIDLDTIVRGIESLDCVPGRMERIECGQPYGTFVDVAASADSLAAALRALRSVTPNRLICVYGSHGEREKSERPLLGRTVERMADIGIITNNNPGAEEPLQIAHDILDGMDRPAQSHLIPDRARAIGWALGNARKGDTVLISGRGHEKEHYVGDRREEFDDRQVARFFLHEMANN